MTPFHKFCLLVAIQILSICAVLSLVFGPSDRGLSYWILVSSLSITVSLASDLLCHSSTMGILIASFSKIPMGLVQTLIGSMYVHRISKTICVPLTAVNVIYQMGLVIYTGNFSNQPIEMMMGLSALVFASLSSA